MHLLAETSGLRISNLLELVTTQSSAVTVSRILGANSKFTGVNKVSGSASFGKTSSAREHPKDWNLILTVKFLLSQYREVQAFVAVDVSSLEPTLILWKNAHSNHTIIITIACFTVHPSGTKEIQTKEDSYGT